MPSAIEELVVFNATIIPKVTPAKQAKKPKKYQLKLILFGRKKGMRTSPAITDLIPATVKASKLIQRTKGALLDHNNAANKIIILPQLCFPIV